MTKVFGKIKLARESFGVATVMAVIICGYAPCFSTDQPSLPATPRKPVTDQYHGIAVTEDYRWLEDFNDPIVRQWNDHNL